MSIPIATTTVTVARPSGGDALDRGAPSTVASGIRAVIGSIRGAETVTAGASEEVTATLTCDPCDLHHDDFVTDDVLGDRWAVTYVRKRIGLGLDHMTAGLVAVTGRAGV